MPHLTEDDRMLERLADPGPSPERRRITRTGWIILGSCGVVAATVYGIATPFVLPALRRYCLPYVPATRAQVENIFSLLRGRTGSLVDLGSGDGRVVIEGARNRFDSHGVELNYWLVLYSRWASWRTGTSHMTRFTKRDLWKTDLSQYNNIVIFGVDSMMDPLRAKLAVEMPPESRVVACRFPLPGAAPIRTIDAGIDSVWMYDKKSLRIPES